MAVHALHRHADIRRRRLLLRAPYARDRTCARPISVPYTARSVLPNLSSTRTRGALYRTLTLEGPDLFRRWGCGVEEAGGASIDE